MDMLNKVRPVNLEVSEAIIYELRSIAANMMVKFSPIINEEVAYRALVTPEQYPIMYAASKLMPTTSFSLDFVAPTVIHKTINVSYSLIHLISQQSIQWLWPKAINFITNDTELGRHLIPVVEMGIRWQTTLELVRLMLRYHKPAIALYSMPWLKTFIENMPKVHEWRNEYNRILSVPQPRDIPGKSRWLNHAMLDGGSLLTQYTLIKDMNRVMLSSDVVIVPRLTIELLDSDDIKSQFIYFCDACKGMGIPELYTGGIIGASNIR